MTRLAGAAPDGADPRLRDAARQLEAMLLRQIVQASGAFKGGEGPGSGVRADLFADALADAVSRDGGIGLTDALVRSLSAGAGAQEPPAPVPGPSARPEPGAALPVAGAVTSGFGARIDPFTGQRTEHDGLDLGAPEGTPIRAPAAGVVRFAGQRGGYGNAVELDHGNGMTTLYGHASALTVSVGEEVAAGQEIARVGSTGRSTGPHLHFEVRVGGVPVNPTRALKSYASRAEAPPVEGVAGRRSS